MCTIINNPLIRNALGWGQIMSCTNKIYHVKQSGSTYASVAIAAWYFAYKISERIFRFIVWMLSEIVISIHLIKIIQSEHKVFPWLQTFITRKLRGIKTYIFFNVTQLKKFFYNTSVNFNMCSFCCTENVKLITNFSLRVLQHVFSYCNKRVCYFRLQICNTWNWCRKHFVLNLPT